MRKNASYLLRQKQPIAPLQRHALPGVLVIGGETGGVSGLGDAAVDDLLERVDAVAGGGVVVVVKMHCDGWCGEARVFLWSLGVAGRRYLRVDSILSWWKKISETAVRRMVVPVCNHVMGWTVWWARDLMRLFC